MPTEDASIKLHELFWLIVVNLEMPYSCTEKNRLSEAQGLTPIAEDERNCEYGCAQLSVLTAIPSKTNKAAVRHSAKEMLEKHDCELERAEASQEGGLA